MDITVHGSSSFARVVVTLAIARRFETRDFLKKEIFNDGDALADDFIFFVKDFDFCKIYEQLKYGTLHCFTSKFVCYT